MSQTFIEHEKQEDSIDLARTSHGQIKVSLTDKLDPNWLVCLIFPAFLTVWFAFDKTWPYWDGASHVHDSLKYCDLIKHLKPLSLSWWHDFLTVNYCYAPEPHIWLGFIKAIFGIGLLSDQIAAVGYSLVLSASTYYLGRKLLNSKLAAVASVLVINSFTLVMTYSHLSYLEYSCLAMFCLAMSALVYWRENQSWQSTIMLGVLIGLAASSKQLVSYFLLAPCLLAFAGVVRAKNKDGALKLVSAALIASLFLLIWLVPNFEQIKSFTQRPCPLGEDASFLDVFVHNLHGYAIQLKHSMSPLLMGAFFVAILAQPKLAFGRLAIVASTLTGVLFMCTIAYNNPESRYIIPVYLFFALATGSFIKNTFDSKNKALKVFGISLIALICLQFLTFNFTPYPVSSPKIITEIPKLLDVKDGGIYSYLPGKHPTPRGDVWGQEWILDSIDKYEAGAPVYLCVLPNDPRYNVHTLNLISKVKKYQVTATTHRLWTLKGDKIEYDTNQLQYYHWYLVKSKSGKKIYYAPFSQEKPKDESSKAALKKTEIYIQNNAKLVSKKQMQDGSEISLYRNSALK